MDCLPQAKAYPKGRPPKSVLRHWVTTVTLQMQGTLLTAVRGPDNEAKESPSKPLVRALRAVILVNAKDLGPDDLFMGDGSGIPPQEAVAKFFGSGSDGYPMHWWLHFVHASEIVGVFHPNPAIRAFWIDFYGQAAESLHMNGETMEQLQHRLRRDGNTTPVEPACPVCGHSEVFPLPPGRDLRIMRCANCLEERQMAKPESGRYPAPAD